MARGWHRDYEEHSLAARGIKTKKKPMTLLSNDLPEEVWERTYDKYMEEADNIINKDIEYVKFPDKMYHLTARKNLNYILENGLEPRGGDRNYKSEAVYLASTFQDCLSATHHRDPDSVFLEVDTRGLDIRIDPEMPYFYNSHGDLYNDETLEVLSKDLKESPKEAWVYTKNKISPDRILGIYEYDDIPHPFTWS